MKLLTVLLALTLLVAAPAYIAKPALACSEYNIGDGTCFKSDISSCSDGGHTRMTCDGDSPNCGPGDAGPYYCFPVYYIGDDCSCGGGGGGGTPPPCNNGQPTCDKSYCTGCGKFGNCNQFPGPTECNDPGHAGGCEWQGYGNGCVGTFCENTCGFGNQFDCQNNGCTWVPVTGSNTTCSGACSGGSCTSQCGCTIACSPPPTCTVDFQNAGQVQLGGSIAMIGNYTTTNGTISSVSFAYSPSGIATISPNPYSNPPSPFTVSATGNAVGTTTVTASATVTGAGGSATCTDTTPTTLTVTPPGPWWQVKDADVITNGDIISPIPSTCTSPQCNPAFDINGDGGYPGVPSYGGTQADFNAGTGTGTVSSKSWLANATSTFKKVYDYSFFKSQIPADVQSSIVEITSPSVNGGFFNSGGAPARGYVWYHFDGATYGDLTMNGNLNLTGSRKVVLLVEGANFLVNGKINIQSKGNGFFMVVVGKTAAGQKGNIVVDPSVTHPNQPGLEGIYYADGTVSTGVGTNWLWLHGSIAAQGGVSLQRNLTDNSRQPAEYFEYAPEIMVLYPNIFTNRRIRWKEVAP